LALFTPRPPPQHLPPMVSKKTIEIGGLAEYADYFSAERPPKRDAWESPKERKERKHKELLETHKAELKKLTEKYDPHKDPNCTGDPFKTLFVARISYDTTEKKLKREFEVFGTIKKVKMMYDKKGKPRGYAFIEYEHERDLKNAYKQGDGKKIDSRRVMVDVERGRTVEGWLPRRLGGGRGPGREGKPKSGKKGAKGATAPNSTARATTTTDRPSGAGRDDKDKDKKGARDRSRSRDKRR